ncbi:hypothetical protein BH11ACT3_BH11ACT3_18900 [soil metagenome]
MTTIGNLLREARRSSNLSQTALSTKSGISQPALSQIESGDRDPQWETVEKVLVATGKSLVAIPTRRDDAATISARISRAESVGDKARALREFIQLSDNLADEHHEVRFALVIAEPAPTGAKHWDAAIAALVTHHLEQEELPVPGWASDPKRRLKRSWTFSSGEYTVPVDRDRVPRAFLDANVLIDRDALVSA